MASGNIRDIDVIINGGYVENEEEKNVTSVNGMTGDVQITKETLGIENVNNTSDLNKPVSTATQAALNAKANASDLSSLASKVTNFENDVDENKANVDGTNATGTWGIDISGNAATATKATSADSATKATQDGDGNVISSTYSKTGHTHNYAGSSSAGGAATSADIATKDGNGNVIVDTYASKDTIALKSTKGTSISVSDSKDAPIILNSAPINLAETKLLSFHKYGITYSTSGDLISISGTATAQTDFRLYSSTNEMTHKLNLKTGTYRFSSNQQMPANVSLKIYTYIDNTNVLLCTISPGTKNTTFALTEEAGISIILRVENGTTVDVSGLRFMIEKDARVYNTPVPYAGYDITSCGKNLIGSAPKPTSGTRCTVEWDGDNVTVTATASKAWSGCTVYIKGLKPNTKYTISAYLEASTTNIYNGLAFGSDAIASLGYGKSGKVTLTNSTNADGRMYILFLVDNKLNGASGDYAKFSNIMLVEGDAALDYEPSVSSSVTINSETVFPLSGLESYEGLTNVINPHSANMEVTYATNVAGQGVLKEIETKAKSSIYGDEVVSMGRTADTTIGTNSFAFGYNVTAIGSNAHAEGYYTTAISECSHTEGFKTTVVGEYAHAEGASTNQAYSAIGNGDGMDSTDFMMHWEDNKFSLASGKASHVGGMDCLALGDYSTATGYRTIASGHYSYAEGCYTTASGDCSHAEGSYTTASGDYSHAEGRETTASGDYSHAEGCYTTAYSYYSHAEGFRTTALTNQHAQGHYNNTGTATANSESGTSTGTAFVIGNGTSSSKSNAFRVTGEGKTVAKQAYSTSGADYAEYFEWLDGNTNNEDRRGLFVTLDGDKIKVANSDDYILGVVSALPSIIGNYDEEWMGRYILDDFGAFITETFECEEEVITGYTEEGDPIIETVTKTGTKWKENPEYDKEKSYTPREERREWDTIGLLGALNVLDDGTCTVNGFCKVVDGGTATASATGYRVIKRVTDNIVKIIVK